jgi:hypothetical protein
MTGYRLRGLWDLGIPHCLAKVTFGSVGI